MTPQVQLLVAVISIWTLIGAAVLVRACVRAVRQRRRYARLQREGDPIDTLDLQLRLGQVATELRTLAASRGFAVAHHTRAAQAAYDALLAEACHRAGLAVEGPVRASDVSRESERLREELELTARGWNW